MNGTVLISAGDVIEVQLTSETVVMQTPEGRRTETTTPGHITNRMRIFLRETDGREAKYDFDDTELGVRETQRVAVVRAQLKKRPEPTNLILFNLSSGEKDVFEHGLRAHLAYRPFFGPLWKAFFFALLIAVIFWAVSYFLVRGEQSPIMSGFWAGFFAFLLFPLLWWLCGIWDRTTERFRYAKARKNFIADMEGRVQAHMPNTAAA